MSPAPARRYIGEPGSCEICGSCGELATWEGQGLMDPAALAVEEIRKRVMQERCRSCRRLQKRPSRIRQPQVAWMGDRPWVPTGGWVWVPEGGGQPSPQQGGRPPTPPPGIQSGYPLGNQAARAQPGSSLTELPKLPAPGSQDASLQFGDWMTIVYPIMRDEAGSAKEWWTQTVSTVEYHYVQWLSAAPLEN